MGRSDAGQLPEVTRTTGADRPGKKLRSEKVKDADFDTELCLNCGAARGGQFCSHCGQRKAKNLQIAVVLREAGRQFLDLDSPWLRTLRELTVRPSSVVLNYAAGARKSYVNPVFYLLVAATLQLLIVKMFDVNLLPAMRQDESVRPFVELVLGSLGYLVVIAGLPAAFLLGILSSGRTAGEHYVALMFGRAHLILFVAVCYVFGLQNLHYWFALDLLFGALWFMHIFSGLETPRWRGALNGLLAHVLLTIFLVVSGALLVIGYIQIER
jgi:hypothetical protein